MAAPSDSASAEEPLFGRDAELAELVRLVDALPERGAARLVRGEPGIGKSALLQVAARRADARGVQVRRASGVQSEAKLPFAGLHQLVLPLLGGVDRLPVPQRTALLAAFGMVATTAAPDRFLIGLATLELLSDAAEQTPLLVIADDAQWLDPSTAMVLGFLARRIEDEPIGLLLAVRSGELDPFADAGLPELVLRGLPDDDAASLLTARGRALAPDVQARLLAEAGGNPLALVELPDRLSLDEREGRMPLPAALPLTARLERAFASRAVSLPEQVHAVLLIAAADDGAGSLEEILGAAQVLTESPVGVDDLEPAVQTRLVDLDDGRIIFRHPLIRSAIHQTASPAQRRTAHRALAESLADQPDRQAWHRAAALTGPDEQVALALDAAADRARSRGAIGTAISTLERSARLSEDGPAKGRRLILGAELAFETGRREQARRMMTEARREDLSDASRHRLTFMRQWFAEESAVSGADLGATVAAAERIAGNGDRTTATNLLLLAAARCFTASAGAEVRRRLLAAAVQLGAGGDDPRLLLVRVNASPEQHGAEVIAALSRLAPDGGVDAETARLLGLAASVVGEYELARSFLSASVDDLCAQGRVGLLATALVLRARVERGLDRWDLAASDADEGRRLAEETAQPGWSARALATEAHLAAVRGESERAEELAEQVERLSLPLGFRHTLTYVQWARGCAALVTGRHDDAYEQLSRVFRPEDPAWHYSERHQLIGDLAEAARNTGRGDDVRDWLTEAESAVAATTSPAGRISVAYAQAMLAEEDDAERAFDHGLDVVGSQRPFTRARLQLAYGSWLRRRRRVMESRAPLNAARETFDALGAVTCADQARGELRASGVESQPRERGTTDDLTPQEMQIARLAAEGLSNREIGGRLFLSHRTVGAHLYRAFPKLGIASRAQLGAVLGTR